jgi:HAE1 family hydrophobic/amphiphilic exporter-1
VSLAGLSIRRPVAMSMFYVAVVVLGVVSFVRLPIDLLPDIAFPTLSVWTTYRGAGPAEVERYVTDPIEEQLGRVPGVRHVTSSSREGQSLVRLQFAWGTDMEFAALHVREQLEELRNSLPETADRPDILTSDPTSDPILTLAVTGEDLEPLAQLSETVLKRRLEQLDGVALAAVTGAPERELRVVVDPDRLDAHGLTLSDITAALDQANYSAPGGMIRRGRFQYSLRTLGQFTDVDQLREVTVGPEGGSGSGRSQGQGAGRPVSESGGRGGSGGPAAPVRLDQVATVLDTVADAQTVSRFDGQPAIGLQVYKESGTNTVRVASQVRATLEQLRSEVPGVRLTAASSQAVFIRQAISNVVQSLLLGGLLAFLVLFLFLRDPRYPVAIGLSIPISVLAAFALCYFANVSLNVMSLGGLALGVGMLVDNSIVVLENVFRHREEEGARSRQAASRGASEVAGAITASTLTTVAVFGPVLYVKGVAGALFGDLSLAVAFSLLASLLVALTLLPVMAARFGGARVASRESSADGTAAMTVPVAARADAGGSSPLVRRLGGRIGGAVHFATRYGAAASRASARVLRFVAGSVHESYTELFHAAGRAVSRVTTPVFEAFDRRFRRFAGRYEEALEWSLDRRGLVLGWTAGLLIAAMLFGETLPRSLMPRVDEGSFRVDLELPTGTPLPVTSRTAAQIEGVLREAKGVESVFARVGRARSSEVAATELSGVSTAALEVRLAAGAPPARDVVASVRRRIRAAGVDPRHVSFETGRASSLGRALGAVGADLAVQVKGQRLDELVAVAESARARLAGRPHFADARIDLRRTQPELAVDIDRDAVARYGLTVRQVADQVEAYLRGAQTSRPYSEFSRKVGIRVVLPAAARTDLPDVLGLTVGGVPLSALVRSHRDYAPVEIRHDGQARTVQVLTDVAGAGLSRAVGEARRLLAGLRTPAGVSVRVGGQNEEMRESFRSLLFAFGLALLLVYLILAAQFESVRQPLVVLISVPLAAIGAVPALWLARDGLNVMSGIGLVILIGIVVNDAIVKVDFINQRRSAGLTLRAAILEAGRLRLRPIVMTTVTTVFGLLPMALGWGAGADLRSPLAVAVIGGLLSSTLLTLIVVPVVYSLVAGRGETVGRPGSPAAATPGA